MGQTARSLSNWPERCRGGKGAVSGVGRMLSGEGKGSVRVTVTRNEKSESRGGNRIRKDPEAKQQKHVWIPQPISEVDMGVGAAPPAMSLPP